MGRVEKVEGSVDVSDGNIVYLKEDQSKGSFKNEAVIVDIDGTLANPEHRLHHIGGATKNWQAFLDACPHDTPYPNIIALVQVLHNAGYHIIYLTGRNERYRAATATWLLTHKCPAAPIYMRPDQDFRSDVIVKHEIYEKQIRGSYEVLIVLEDREKVVEMWRSLGLTCLQVQAGKY